MDPVTQHRNARAHLLERALYIGSGAFIAGPTVVPAIVQQLGGSATIVGILPLVIYFAFYAPQLVSALHARTFSALKPWVLKGGLVQRLHILAMAAVLALAASGVDGPILTLFLVLLALNQFSAGLVSPLWFEFLTRTTSVHERGMLLGWRSAAGALLSFANSFVLTAALAKFGFGWGTAIAFAVAFFFQGMSWIAQRRVAKPVSVVRLEETARHGWSDVVRILRTDVRLRRFLMAWGFVTAGASTGVFVLPAAAARFGPDAAAVGIYTIVLVAAQMMGGGVLGWLTDRRGALVPLMICGVSSASALAIATLAGNPGMMVAAFMALGIPSGAEMMARYSFAAEVSPPGERALYVGLMNVWLAPWQALSVMAGLGVERWGYVTVFVSAIASIVIGVVLLCRVPSASVA